MIGLKKSSEKGATMMEVIGVLGVIGCLSVGALAGYTKIMSKFNVSKTIEQSQRIIKNVSAYFASQRRYDNLDAEGLFKLGFLTEESYRDDLKKAFHPLNGEIQFATGSIDGVTPNTTYSVRYTGYDTVKLPIDVCIALATMDINVRNLYKIVINKPDNSDIGHVFPASGVEYDPALHLPYDQSTAITDCATEDEVSVMFMFY